VIPHRHAIISEMVCGLTRMLMMDRLFSCQHGLIQLQSIW
jgi:hypothetical protein